MKKGLLIVASTLAALLLAAGIYVFADDFNRTDKVFQKGTVINGVDCVGLDVEQTCQALSDAQNEKNFTVSAKGQSLATINLSKAGCPMEYDIEASVQGLLKSELLRFRFPDILPGSNSRNKEISMVPKSVPKETTAYLTSFDFLNNKYTVKAKNAYVDTTKWDFPMVKEQPGDNVDKEAFSKDVLKNMAEGKTSMEYEASNYYATPEITSDSPELKEYQKYCLDNLATRKVTLKTTAGEMIVPPEYMAKMIKQDAEGKPQVDEKAVEDYVYNVIDKEYSTLTKERSFVTARGTTVTVPPGNYGDNVDCEAETAQLIKDLNSGQAVTRDMNYYQTAYAKDAENDIGNSYVEVDISNQRVYLFVNGEMITSTDTVTGNVSMGDGTPPGAFALAYKQQGATLRGLNYDGTKYASKVKYWMPFNGGIGLHDAPWRNGLFGGSYYLTEGSHGCVNLPESVALTIFNYVEPGFPVIVHY